MKHIAAEMTYPEFAERIKEAKAVLVPVGSCEQHGYHLPLGTDNSIGEYVATKAAELANCIVMPNVNYGQVWSAKNFPGTISLSDSTLELLLREIIIALENNNAKNIILVPGHNGNITVFKSIARKLLDEFNYTNIWYFNNAFDKELVSLQESAMYPVFHAGELETSMMMAIDSTNVYLDRCEPSFPKAPKESSYKPMHWDEYNNVGSFGDASKASAEKGQQLLDSTVNNLVKLINEYM